MVVDDGNGSAAYEIKECRDTQLKPEMLCKYEPRSHVRVAR